MIDVELIVMMCYTVYMRKNGFINLRLDAALKRKLESISYSRSKLEQRRVTVSEIVRETLEQTYKLTKEEQLEIEL